MYRPTKAFDWRGSDLRKGRASVTGQIYHVTATTLERQRIFENLALGRIVVACMKHEAEWERAHTLCYVVMPDHFHWLLQLGVDQSISQVVNNVKGHSARRINTAIQRQGALWQKGFFDRAIRQEEDLAAIARYIVANPQRAGIVRSCRECGLAVNGSPAVRAPTGATGLRPSGDRALKAGRRVLWSQRLLRRRRSGVLRPVTCLEPVTESVQP